MKTYFNLVIAVTLVGIAFAATSSVSAQPAARSASPFQAEMDGSMAVMDRAMMAAPMNGRPDHDFAAMMIPHHQGAVAMARAELLYGKDPILRRLAEEIIVTQQQEILVMQRQLARSARTAQAVQKPARRPEASFQEASFSVLTSPALRLEAPGVGPAIAIGPAVSARDRVYSGDQTSNTVSVINPATNTLLGVIRLGDPAPASILPLYKGQLLVHGLGFSPDHKTLDVISIGSNSVTLIDTATNTVKGTVYVGRAPHEGFFTPSGKELWVAVRGEDYVSIIDPVAMKEVRRGQTANGPGMILFSPDGRYAFVPSSFTPELDVVDTRSYQVIARVPQVSPFSPNLAVSADGEQVWFTLKDTGRTQIISAHPPFAPLGTLDTGPITNHVTCVDNAHGHFAYVTVGGLNEVKVYSRQAPFPLVATIPTGDLPHGIWSSGDGNRVYVGLENSDAMAAINTLTNTVIATIPIGQTPQAVVYVPDAVPTGTGTSSLVPLGQATEAVHLTLVPPAGSSGAAQATVAINSLGLVDLLQIAVSGLVPGKQYQLALVDRRTAPYGSRLPLTNFKANSGGAQIAQTIGPLRQAVTAAAGAGQPAARYLVLSPVGSDAPILVQQP
jgi:YVTN family beta-propeller protein